MRTSLTPPTDPAEYRFAHTVRTRFAETDAMGVIHHAAYLPYLEDARVAWLEELGFPYEEVRAGGVDLVVVEAMVQYRRPLRFGELVTVSLLPGAVTRTTFQIAYLLQVDGETRATAVTVHGAVDGAGRPQRLPGWLVAAVDGRAEQGCCRVHRTLCHNAATMEGNQSPTIHRCGMCGGLVHPGDRSSAAAWCRRCGRIVGVTVDGGLTDVTSGGE